MNFGLSSAEIIMKIEEAGLKYDNVSAESIRNAIVNVVIANNAAIKEKIAEELAQIDFSEMRSQSFQLIDQELHTKGFVESYNEAVNDGQSNTEALISAQTGMMSGIMGAFVENMFEAYHNKLKELFKK